MKIQGVTLGNEYARPFALPRPDGSEWRLRLAPLPLGFHRRLSERGIVSPAPPSQAARDSRGQLLKDAQGMAVLMFNPHEPGYLAQRERHQQHLAVLTIYEALRHDPDVEFSATPPAEGSWGEFAEQLCRELEEAGWTLGDVGVVCDEIFRLSNLLDGDLQRAEQGFSSSAPKPGETPSLRIHDPSNI
ncbi:MAG TPA: hypothetical protein VMM56_05385 [Planctomycetaceae bacterium]|nr:hypothetical protein [Planctomycetaceae bacterium]